MAIVPTPYRLLALAVLESACKDASAGLPDAQHFLMKKTPQLDLWCQLLELTPTTIRRVIERRQWPEQFARARALLTGPPGPTPGPDETFPPSR